MNGKIYFDIHLEFLRDNVKGKHFDELAVLFNERFGMSQSTNSISAVCKNHRITNGLVTRFQKGQEFNDNQIRNRFTKGKSHINSIATQFKPGNISANNAEIGSVAVRKDGYLWVKVGKPNIWKAKHVLVFEDKYGPVPDKHVVIFLDRNIENFDISNLACISRNNLLYMNRNKLIFTNKDLTEAGILLAKLNQKVTDKKRK